MAKSRWPYILYVSEKPLRVYLKFSVVYSSDFTNGTLLKAVIALLNLGSYFRIVTSQKCFTKFFITVIIYRVPTRESSQASLVLNYGFSIANKNKFVVW